MKELYAQLKHKLRIGTRPVQAIEEFVIHLNSKLAEALQNGTQLINLNIPKDLFIYYKDNMNENLQHHIKKKNFIQGFSLENLDLADDFDSYKNSMYSLNVDIFLLLAEIVIDHFIYPKIKTSKGFSKSNKHFFNHTLFKLSSSATNTQVYIKIHILDSKKSLVRFVPVVPQMTNKGKVYHLQAVNLKNKKALNMTLVAHALDRINQRDPESDFEDSRQKIIDMLINKLTSKDFDFQTNITDETQFNIFIAGGLLLGNGAPTIKNQDKDKIYDSYYTVVKTYISESMFTPEQIEIKSKTSSNNKTRPLIGVETIITNTNTQFRTS